MNDFNWEGAAARENDRLEAELIDLRERYAHANAEYEAMMGQRDNIADNLALLERHDQEKIDRLEDELLEMTQQRKDATEAAQRYLGQRWKLQDELRKLAQRFGVEEVYRRDAQRNLVMALADKDKAEAELVRVNKLNDTLVGERNMLREALVGLLHHMPLRGEPVTAKELAIKRARDVLAGKGVSDGK